MNLAMDLAIQTELSTGPSRLCWISGRKEHYLVRVVAGVSCCSTAPALRSDAVSTDMSAVMCAERIAEGAWAACAQQVLTSLRGACYD